LNDARTQRERHADLAAAVDRDQAPPADCSSAVVLTLVEVASYPTDQGVYYGGNPTDVGGVEQEGIAATYVTSAVVLYAINVGTQVPGVGTKVIAHSVGGRLVFRFDG
jgi:hypothetical protein